MNRNRYKFFTKTKNLNSFSLPLLIILAFLLVIFNKTDYFLVNKLKTFSIDFVDPFTKIVTYPVKISFETINSINNIRFLQKENNKLKEELIRLKKWQLIAIKNSRENKAYKKLLNSTTNEMTLIKTAIVKSRSSDMFSKSLIINAGLDNNVKDNHIVINERGLVGKILHVSKNNSKILLVNDQNSAIPVKTLDKIFYAILKGSSDGKYLISSFTKEENTPKIGDILVTSGNANVYPSDILVGKVVEIHNDKIIALPFVDLQNIEFVKVIDNN